MNKPMGQYWSEPLRACGAQPYHFRYTLEDGTVIDVPDDAQALFRSDGEHIWLRVLESDGMTDYPLSSCIAHISESSSGPQS
jgi:hypothetical protein